MKEIGYIPQTTAAARLQQGIRRLQRSGVPLAGITVGDSITRLVDSLRRGDRLTTFSLSCLSSGQGRQQFLVNQIERRGAVLRLLDEEPLRRGIKGLFRWLTKRPDRTPRPRKPSVRTSTLELERRIRACLPDYYAGKVSVQKLCRRRRITPAQLYRYRKDQRLPGRWAVRNDASLNPLSGGELAQRVSATCTGEQDINRS